MFCFALFRFICLINVDVYGQRMPSMICCTSRSPDVLFRWDTLTYKAQQRSSDVSPHFRSVRPCFVSRASTDKRQGVWLRGECHLPCCSRVRGACLLLIDFHYAVVLTVPLLCSSRYLLRCYSSMSNRQEYRADHDKVIPISSVGDIKNHRSPWLFNETRNRTTPPIVHPYRNCFHQRGVIPKLYHSELCTLNTSLCKSFLSKPLSMEFDQPVGFRLTNTVLTWSQIDANQPCRSPSCNFLHKRIIRYDNSFLFSFID